MKIASLSRILFLVMALCIMAWNVPANLLTARSAQEDRGKFILGDLFQQLGLPSSISDGSEINFDDQSEEEGLWQYSVIKPYEAVREGLTAVGWYGGYLIISRAYMPGTDNAVMMTCKTMAKVLVTEEPNLASQEINNMQSQAKSHPQQAKLETIPYNGTEIWTLAFDASETGGGVDQIAAWQSQGTSFLIRFDSSYQGKGDLYNLIGNQCPFNYHQPDLKTWYKALHDLSAANTQTKSGPDRFDSGNDPGKFNESTSTGLNGIPLISVRLPTPDSRLLWLSIFGCGSITVICVIAFVILLLSRRQKKTD